MRWVQVYRYEFSPGGDSLSSSAMIWDSRTATATRPVGGQRNLHAPVGTAQKRLPLLMSMSERASLVDSVPAGTTNPERVADSSSRCPTRHPGKIRYPLMSVGDGPLIFVQDPWYIGR